LHGRFVDTGHVKVFVGVGHDIAEAGGAREALGKTGFYDAGT
jgi:hypothetical protein